VLRGYTRDEGKGEMYHGVKIPVILNALIKDFKDNENLK
jgi:hypothetical protein